MAGIGCFLYSCEVFTWLAQLIYTYSYRIYEPQTQCSTHLCTEQKTNKKKQFFLRWNVKNEFFSMLEHKAAARLHALWGVCYWEEPYIYTLEQNFHIVPQTKAFTCNLRRTQLTVWGHDVCVFLASCWVLQCAVHCMWCILVQRVTLILMLV